MLEYDRTALKGRTYTTLPLHSNHGTKLFQRLLVRRTRIVKHLIILVFVPSVPSAYRYQCLTHFNGDYRRPEIGRLSLAD